MKSDPSLSTRISGIPCGIVVDHFRHTPPWRGPIFLCPSDIDFYGQTEMEWHVVDRRGYRADWLARKLTPADVERIEKELLNQL